MATQVNYPELKAYLLKFYQLYEQVFEHYFREVNISDTKCPVYVVKFLSNLIELKQEWENLLNTTLEDVVAKNMDLSKFDAEFKDTTVGLMSLNYYMQYEIIAQFFSYSRKKEYRPYFDLWKQIEVCEKSEIRIFDYICRYPVTDKAKQARIVKAVYNIELKTKPIVQFKSIFDVDNRTEPIVQPESTIDVDNKTYENGCLLAVAVIVGLPTAAIIAYVFAAFSVGDTSEQFSTWFAISFIVFAFIFILLGYLSAKYGKEEKTYSSNRRGRKSKEYSFWRLPRKKILSGYDPSKWKSPFYRPKKRKRTKWWY